MKSFRKKILTCILLFASAICLVLAGCSTKDVKLSFETNGGAPIEEIVAVVGDEVQLPTPEREGYSFEGWYENADLSGNAVTSVVAESSKTFYAKWEQMYEIKLELGGGQLSAPKLYAKEGQTIADVVKDLVPTRTGWQFGEWQMNGAALSPSAKMPKSEVTLTARYKVGYTVHVWLQKEGDGFEQGEDIVGYDYPAANYTPDVTVKGYEVAEHAGEVKSGPLSEDPASNVFTFYLERGHYQITLLSNYPIGMDDEIVTIEFTYGDEVVLPYDRFRAEGYLLMGWSRSVVDTVDYPSQVIDGLLRNGDGVKREDKVSLDEDTTLYAIWEEGYTDLFGGEDVIYHLQGETDRLILERYGSYYQGEYVTATESFYFYDKADNISLQGKFFGSGFAYYNEARDGQIYYRYVVGRGVYTYETISLDAYNGIKYTVRGGSSMAGVSEGTYYIDEQGYCHATFTDGVKTGSELIMLFGSVTVSGTPMRVFMAREDDDIAHGQMYFCGIMEDGEMGAVPSAYLLELDGFGSAVMDMGTSKTNYLYMTGSNDTFSLYTTSGSLYGTFKFVKFGSREGYMLYDSALDFTASDDAGNTLKLDGACNAVVTVGGVSKSGYFVAEDSAFGGSIVSVFLNDGKHVYLTGSERDENNTLKRVFEEKDAGYAEYYYRSNAGRNYYTPLLVIENAEEHKASVYGYTENREFLKVAEGTYTYNEETGNYQFKVETSLDPEGELILEPIDVTRLDSFVYSVGVASNLNVSYWHSFTYKGEEPTDYDEEYKSEKDDEGKLILVGGFAVYSAKDVERVAGVYSQLSGYTGVIRVQNGNTYLYFELNSEKKTFVVLDKFIGTLRERLASGEADSSVTLSFDGKGGATLTVTPEEGEPKVTEGAYSEAEDTAFETPVLHFTPKDSAESGFDFVVLSTSSASYFTRLNAMEKELTSEKDGKLKLDGFSYKARYTDADENVIEGRYLVPEEGVILFSDEDGTVTYYFDVKEGGTFTRRGPEAADYLLVENQYISGVALRFDGYGKLTVLRLAESDEEGEEIIGSGEYRKDGDLWSLVYEEEATGSKVELKGILGIILITETSGYRVFSVEHKEISRVYINEEDWSVFVPDGHGNAELRNKYGQIERGTYTIINGELLYYMNSAQTDACIYRYDAETGAIEKLDYTEHGYYTTDLRSLRFSRYGFMIMDGETQYYYTVDGSGEITVYLRDPENENANEYGFVSEEIGKFEDTITFKDVTYINNNGFPIRFERAESTKDKYPAPYEEDENGDLIKKPLRLLTFQPTGSAEFSVTGAVAFEGEEQALQCTVVREIISAEGEEEQEGQEEEFALYLLIAGYRFDIEVTYHGEEGNTYEVVGLRYIQRANSNYYYALYFLLAMFGYSGTFENVYGNITIVREYDEQGDLTEQYLDVDLGAQHNIRLMDGTVVTKLEHANYKLDKDGNLFVVTQEYGEYTYKFYFGLSVNSYFNVVGCDLVACTRVQTLESGDYTVEIERLLATDLNGRIGSPYDVSLKKGDTEIDVETILVLTDKTYCISRTREHLETDAEGVNSGKITSTTYYELVLTDENPEQVGGDDDDGKSEGEEGGQDEDAEGGEGEGDQNEDSSETGTIVPLYATVTVTEHKATYYGDSYNNVDVFEDGQVAGFMRGGTQYCASSSTYDEVSKTYTVSATNGHRYSIKLEERNGETYVTVTQLQDIVEEEDEQGGQGEEN